MAKDGWYGKGKSEGEGAKKEGVHERHMRERGEAHMRHHKARDDMHKSHQDELAQMAERQAAEMQPGGAPGDQGAAMPSPAPGGNSPMGGAAMAAAPPAAAGAPGAAAACSGIYLLACLWCSVPFTRVLACVLVLENYFCVYQIYTEKNLQ